MKTDSELIDRFNDDLLLNRGFTYDKMNYKDWNNLMPVVHKILKGYEPPEGQGWPYEYMQLEATRIGNSIEYVYQRVIAFIKWHNHNKQV